MKSETVEKLTVKIYNTCAEIGKAAAEDAARRINAIIADKGEANIVFAAAPSQNELLKGLLESNIDWSKVRGFHQDEYVGITDKEPAGFGNFLRRAIFDKVNFKELHYMLCDESATEAKCEEYTDLLRKHPIDLIFLGFGENGHMAFNDPAVADFNDPKMIKVVALDDVCRQQQVNDGCFATIDDVPTHAMTLTVPTLVRAPYLFCIVPAKTKARAVYETLNGSVDEHCPASILRTHENAVLYLDNESSKLL